jgi:tetratricopeptide (TPR) repeat protein
MNLMRRAGPLTALLLLTLAFLALPFDTPLSNESNLDVVISLQQNKRPVQALFHLKVLAAREGWQPAYLRLAGDLWREMGSTTQALSYWEAAVHSQPADPELIRALAEGYLTTQQWSAASDQLEQLVAANPQDAWAHYHLGLVRLVFNPQQAAAHLQQAARTAAYAPVARSLLAVIRQQADNPLIGMHAGLILADAQLWSFAELAFRHAADIGQIYPEALAYVGFTRQQQGKDGGEWLRRAAALGTQSALAQFFYGLYLRDQDDLSGSLQALIQAVVLEPENPAYYAELGTAYRLLGDLENAERWLRMAAAVSHEDVRFQQLLATFYAEEHLDQSAVSALERIAGTLPDDPSIQASLAWATYRSGDTTGAYRILDDILSRLPDHPQSLYYKARIALETADRDTALTLLRRLVALNSSYTAEASRMLSSLEGGN